MDADATSSIVTTPARREPPPRPPITPPLDPEAAIAVANGASVGVASDPEAGIVAKASVGGAPTTRPEPVYIEVNPTDQVDAKRIPVTTFTDNLVSPCGR